MSFQTGLSGLSAASQNLDVIGNNIANANTVGMKASRGEFSDLIASAIGSTGTTNMAGIGVAQTTISQNFSQGNVSITGNTLDVAINGNGFYAVTKTDGTVAYSRDGQFKLDKDGNIVNNSGSKLMGYDTDVNGARSGSLTPHALSIPTGAPIAAQVTSKITAEFNLDARAPLAATAPVTPRSTYGTSLTAFDTQGRPQALNLYFSRIDPSAGITTLPNTDQWEVYTSLDATAQPAPVGVLAFNSDGSLNTGSTFPPAAGLTVTSLPADPAVPDITITAANVDISGVTQYGTSFAVSNLTQNGYTSGQYTGMTIDNKGVISTRYSNGQTLKTGGMIALADFRNVQGLTPSGGGEYLASYKSGDALLGQPTVGNFGELRSGAVEESNVDLTAELVNMMTAQRNYQANAQTIKTQDQVMSTLVNLR
jgi:flagellar hook protein FlgE